jgi:uncharacterized damage-inducible protein DinB
MTENVLVKLFEHNNWANLQIIQACSALNEVQLDAEPQSATAGSIRSTLMHLVSAQRGYLSLLTQPVSERRNKPLAFTELLESATLSGEGLRSLVKDDSSQFLYTRLQTMDGFYVEPWVVLLQVINHATEHREQIKSMLSALGLTPPSIDSWDYGEKTNALVPIPD